MFCNYVRVVLLGDMVRQELPIDKEISVLSSELECSRAGIGSGAFIYLEPFHQKCGDVRGRSATEARKEENSAGAHEGCSAAL